MLDCFDADVGSAHFGALLNNARHVEENLAKGPRLAKTQTILIEAAFEAIGRRNGNMYLDAITWFHMCAVRKAAIPADDDRDVGIINQGHRILATCVVTHKAW